MDKMAIITAVRITVVTSLLLLSQACTLTVSIDDPEVSTTPYTNQNHPQPTQLAFKSKLAENHQPSESKLPIMLANDGENLLSNNFILTHLQAELTARGMLIEFSDQAENSLLLEDFEILSHRVSGFSPMVTLSMAKAELKTARGSRHIQSIVKRAKVPVWSMDELNEPCYNEPVELLIKELVAKINREMVGGSLADSEVDSLVKNIQGAAGDRDLAYIDVYELGFSNNLKAIPTLVELTRHQSDYVRLAAISGLGILGDPTQLDYLKSIYNDASLWQDRAMALKAIGDLNTDQSKDFLVSQRGKWSQGSANEDIWNTKVINLYLD